MIIRIKGRVQGVFFRTEVKKIADVLGITGWVKNEPDGSVAVVAEGKEEELQKLIEWCKKGTDISRVENVEVEWKDATGEFADFIMS